MYASYVNNRRKDLALKLSLLQHKLILSHLASASWVYPLSRAEWGITTCTSLSRWKAAVKIYPSEDSSLLFDLVRCHYLTLARTWISSSYCSLSRWVLTLILRAAWPVNFNLPLSSFADQFLCLSQLLGIAFGEWCASVFDKLCSGIELDKRSPSSGKHIDRSIPRSAPMIRSIQMGLWEDMLGNELDAGPNIKQKKK